MWRALPSDAVRVASRTPATRATSRPAAVQSRALPPGAPLSCCRFARACRLPPPPPYRHPAATRPPATARTSLRRCCRRRATTRPPATARAALPLAHPRATLTKERRERLQIERRVPPVHLGIRIRGNSVIAYHFLTSYLFSSKIYLAKTASSNDVKKQG